MKRLSKLQIRQLKKIVGYKGITLHRTLFKPGMSVNSYWDEGSRDYWFLVNCKTFSMREIPQNGTPFDRLNLTCDALGPDEVLVLKPIVGGKVGMLTIYS